MPTRSTGVPNSYQISLKVGLENHLLRYNTMADSNHDLPDWRAIYHKYKTGTKVIVDYLVEVGVKKSETKAASTRLSVRQILTLARNVAEQSIQPPANIRNAFRVTLVNRQKLTHYYENLPELSDDTSKATERHQFFNETLTGAYDILFPTKKTSLPHHRFPKGKESPSMHPVVDLMFSATSSKRNRSSVITRSPSSQTMKYHKWNSLPLLMMTPWRLL